MFACLCFALIAITNADRPRVHFTTNKQESCLNSSTVCQCTSSLSLLMDVWVGQPTEHDHYLPVSLIVDTGSALTWLFNEKTSFWLVRCLNYYHPDQDTEMIAGGQTAIIFISISYKG